MAPTPPAYHLPSIRLGTFLQKRKGARKGLNWPTTVNSESEEVEIDLEAETAKLISEGFYHHPTSSNPLSIKCYLCSLEIKTPPPFLLLPSSPTSPTVNEISSLHLSLSPLCPLAIIRSESRESDASKASEQFYELEDGDKIWGEIGMNWPRGKRMEEARLGTFLIGWPSEGEEGIPTKEEIAKAGWYFRPGIESDENDQCVCPCCTRTVGGWEEGDDPIALHHKKEGLTCPFFTSLIDPTPPTPPTPIAAPVPEILSPVSVVPVIAPKSSKSTTTKATPKSSSAAGGSRSTGGRGKKILKEVEVIEIEEEEEEEQEEEGEEEVLPPTQSTRSSRRKVIASTTTSDHEIETVVKAPLKKSTRATKSAAASKKAVALQVEPEVEPEAIEEEIGEVPIVDPVVEVVEEEEAVVAPSPVAAPAKGKGKAKSTRGVKSQVSKPIIIDESIIEKEEIVEKEKEKEKEKEEEIVVVEPEVEREVEVEVPVKEVIKKAVVAKGKKVAKAGKGKGNAIVVVEPEDENEAVVPEADEDIPTISEPTPPVVEASKTEEDVVMEEVIKEVRTAVIEVEIPVMKAKSKGSTSSKGSKSRSVAASYKDKEVVEPSITIDIAVVERSAIIESTSPRPIKSLPQKPTSNKVPLPSLTTSTATITTASTSTSLKSNPKSTSSKTNSKPSSKSSENSSAPSSTSTTTSHPLIPLPPFISRSNPFRNQTNSNSSLTLPPPTPEELNLTIKEYYDLCGKRNYDLLEKEMRIDLEGLKTRIGIARGYLVEMCGGKVGGAGGGNIK